jgi:hypothetical protein
MNRDLSITVIIILPLLCSFSQANDLNQLTRDLKKDINILLPEGRRNADIMDFIKRTKRQEEHMKKFQEGVRKNHQWFVNSIKNVP